MNDDICKEWFVHAMQFIHHPVALVNKEQRFVWTNAAYERLVGYSEAELLGKTWMQITEMSDVGSDLASVESISVGDRTTYTTTKKYIHKGGDEISVAITVWRFPVAGELVGFSVEAMPESSLARIDQIHRLHVKEIQELNKRLDSIEAQRKMLESAFGALLKWMPLVVGAGAALAWLVETFVIKN